MPPTRATAHARDAAPARRRARTAAVAATTVAVSLLAGACGMANVADPRWSDLLPSGSTGRVTASDRDVAYGPDTGCGPDATSHERCGGSQTLDIYPAGIVASSAPTTTAAPTTAPSTTAPEGGPGPGDAGSEVLDDRDPQGPPTTTPPPTRPGDRRTGTIVFIHGGGFTGGAKSNLTDFAPILRQTERGWDVVVVNYRLSNPRLGTAMYPTPLLDVERALDWVRTKGATHGLDTTQVVVGGESAGGGLAALIGTAWNSGRAELAGIDRVDGYISISGVLDLETPTARFWSSMWISHPIWLPIVTATTHLDAADPPAWLVHGDQDGVVEAAASQHFKAVADRGGFGHLVDYDLVDLAADGTPLGDAVRNHTPSAGANVTALDAWLDRIAAT